MLLQINNISKSFGSFEILKNCSFHISSGEKCALVGINGAGKTTLLRIITGEMEADEGSVSVEAGASIGYLSQQNPVDSHNTIYEELSSVKSEIFSMEENLRRLEIEMKSASEDSLPALMDQYTRLTHEYELKNGYAAKSEITGVLKGLGFSPEDYSRRVSTLSGGQKTRVALGRILLEQPDLVILDEPTNHLDIGSIEWLEGFLRGYRGAVLVVAHDRYFLDKIVMRVFELENGTCTAFNGNYTFYAREKKKLRDSALREWMNQQDMIRHQESVISKLKQFNREKSVKRAESRQKLLDKTVRLERPVSPEDAMRIKITPSITSGKDVLSVEHLSKSFPDTELFNDISFEIHRGERVALIGSNGTGKTTLLKILNGLERPDEGYFRMGTNVKTGYYDQEHQLLHPDKTLFDEISDSYPDMDNTRIRNTLAAFLFTGDEVFKYIRELSGGERGRLALARLMLSRSNFLILDEPTNHLDITSKEILGDCLVNYEGTVLYVSHDRYFVNQTATRILDLTSHTLVNYLGNYDYYLLRRDQLSLSFTGKESETGRNSLTGGSAAESGDTKSSKTSWQEQKARQALARKQKNDLEKCEEQIYQLEERLKVIDEKLCEEETATDPVKCRELSEERSSIEEQLEKFMEQWETMAQS